MDEEVLWIRKRSAVDDLEECLVGVPLGLCSAILLEEGCELGAEVHGVHGADQSGEVAGQIYRRRRLGKGGVLTLGVLGHPLHLLARRPAGKFMWHNIAQLLVGHLQVRRGQGAQDSWPEVYPGLRPHGQVEVEGSVGEVGVEAADWWLPCPREGRRIQAIGGQDCGAGDSGDRVVHSSDDREGELDTLALGIGFQDGRLASSHSSGGSLDDVLDALLTSEDDLDSGHLLDRSQDSHVGVAEGSEVWVGVES